jgi:broad specificity phosphatase PhoE
MNHRFVLVRHGMCAQTDSHLLGRTMDSPLSPQGLQQAAAVARQIAELERVRIESSPRLRTRETAAAIAEACGMKDVGIAAALDEIDFGEWSGKSFTDLEADTRWRQWNSQRSKSATAAGETMCAVYERAIAHIQLLSKSHPDCTHVLVTHADVIRSIILTELRASLDDFWKLIISPASITRLSLSDGGFRFESINECSWA